ncbi:DMT family transporter [Jiella pacifica]|uniref:EamA family transporter n=1 Tax=Jiella pacifica TaxID=2696469 RepID=A0A6N9T2J0_9HYPH|nr:DMT family transporter [Jiella pacifica]NDW05567.1 EamA family transporter [Jiella pacifica]
MAPMFSSGAKPPVFASSGRQATIAGIAAILGAVMLLSLSDALVKLWSDRLALAQLILLRSVVAALALAALLPFVGGSRFRPRRLGWVTLRSLLLASMWGCCYVALADTPLPTAAAALYTAPLMMALFSAWFLDDPFGRRGWLAVGLGFVGILLMLRPDVADLSPTALLPFVSAACYALAAIVTRSRCAAEEAFAMALNLHLVLVLTAAAALAVLAVFGPAAAAHGSPSFLTAVWLPLGMAEWGMIVLLGLFMVVIATAVARAYQIAPTPVVGVFDNAYLAFAAAWSASFFGTWPDLAGSAGIVLIAVSGAVAVWRPAARTGTGRGSGATL